MTIKLLDPTGVVAKTATKAEALLETLRGRKVGFVFNQHATGLTFWEALEKGVQETFSPSSVERLYKDNTWAPAPKTLVDRLVAETDYALVGLGA
jgi:hypothetical protein